MIKKSWAGNIRDFFWSWQLKLKLLAGCHHRKRGRAAKWRGRELSLLMGWSHREKFSFRPAFLTREEIFRCRRRMYEACTR